MNSDDYFNEARKPDTPESLFRLRIADTTVGYMRKPNYSDKFWYSRDLYWWNGKKITYEHKDPYLGLKDKEGRPIFHEDAILHDSNGSWKIGKIFYHDGKVIIRKRSRFFLGLNKNQEMIFESKRKEKDPLLMITRPYPI